MITHSPIQIANDPDMIAEEITVSTGARSGDQWAYTVSATKIEATGGFIKIHAADAATKGKGGDILISIPYGVLPDLLHRVLASQIKDSRIRQHSG